MAPHQPIYLTLWAEVVGIFQGISSDDLYTYVEVDNKLLLFPRESTESCIILNKLNRELIGRKIGPRKEIQLRPWEEIRGTLSRLEADEFKISAILSCTHKDMAITFSKGSQEATILKQTLNNLLGQKIAILKTDSPQQPIIIKPFTVTTEAVKRRSQIGRYSYSLEK